MDKYCTIKVKKTGRYIVWSDDCWYETGLAGKHYTRDEAVEVFETQLKKHYVYEVVLEFSDGTTEELSAFSNRPQILKIGSLKIVRKPESDTKSEKKSLFKFKMKKSC